MDISVFAFEPLKNVDDAVEYLYSVSNEEGAKEIDLTLEPSDDGAESDVDDPSEDSVDIGQKSINLLGAKLLAKGLHIELTNRN